MNTPWCKLVGTMYMSESGQASLHDLFDLFTFAVYTVNSTYPCTHNYVYVLLNPTEDLVQTWGSTHVFVTSKKGPSELQPHDIRCVCDCEHVHEGRTHTQCELASLRFSNPTRPFSQRIPALLQEKPWRWEHAGPWCKHCKGRWGNECAVCQKSRTGGASRHTTLRVHFQHPYAMVPDVRWSVTPIDTKNVDCTIDELTHEYVVFRLQPVDIERDVEGTLTYHIHGPVHDTSRQTEDNLSDPA
jgi:hypothetical protein